MSDDLIPQQIITLVSMMGGMVCIYLSNLSFGGIFSIIATVLFTVLGTNTLRYIGKYSLGTGIPSIVYMLTSLGIMANLLAIILAYVLKISFIMPILTLLFATVLPAMVYMICRHIFKIEVNILLQSFIKITVSSAFTILAMATLICNGYDYNLIFNNVYANVIVLVLMFATIMSIQNPYNACMGPNEEQYRTLYLSLTNIFLMLSVVSIISILNTSLWYIYLIISLIFMAVSLYKYVQYTYRQVASVKYYGLWESDDGSDYYD